MSVHRPLLAGLSVLVAAAVSAGVGLDLTPSTAHTPTPTISHSARPVPAETADPFGPSTRWLAASPEERAEAERVYLHMFGSWENGCRKDLRHSYNGMLLLPKDWQTEAPELADQRVKGDPDRYVAFLPYDEGVCS